jgi:hypothetical protein
MDGLLLGFVVFFVLALACGCALWVVRVLARTTSSGNPPWPHLQSRIRRQRLPHKTRHIA